MAFDFHLSVCIKLMRALRTSRAVNNVDNTTIFYMKRGFDTIIIIYNYDRIKSSLHVKYYLKPPVYKSRVSLRYLRKSPERLHSTL